MSINHNRRELHVAIVGGGISGLATAFFIRRFAPDSRVAIFEKEPRFGGSMQSEHRNGFLFEAGPNGFLSNRARTLDLVQESGAKELLLKSSDDARIRYIFTDGLQRLPDTPAAFLSTGLLSLRDKLRVFGEIFIPPKKGPDDETLRAFGYRRFGHAFTDVFLDAMSAGIYASTPDRLSVHAAFPAIVKLEREYGGLFRSMIKKRKKEAGSGGILMSFRGGVGAFAEHLANILVNTLSVKLHIASPVTELRRTNSGYRITVNRSGSNVRPEIEPKAEFKAESVILATPAYISAGLVAPMDQEIANKLRTISYSPVAVVGFGFENIAHPLHGFGLLTTASAEQKILGVLWDSSIFPGRAPAGKQSLRVLIGGQRNPELALRDKSELIDIAREGIRRTMSVHDAPSTIFIKRWTQGIPNYPVGHIANVLDIQKRMKAYPGLSLNSNAYFGIGINDCIINSLASAKRWVGERSK
uniref:Oxygen-dependent protoporphyrinogen oxidase n=1 Tax=Candidatus Kentrum sp. TC TaxID=2126339 RepID=A0A450YRY5_9GAMM|nr:MAG: oxygen-dependent protoporphyrinogen oxidase [Candidatus Kentron sp. TC]